MIFILEGPDNAGKTTLARQWQDALADKIQYFHPGGKPDNMWVEKNCMDEQLETVLTCDNIILDRVTAISQQVYNPHATYDVERNGYIQKMLKCRVVIIYCRPSDDRLMRTEDFTWRDEETEEHKQKIIRNQHQFIKNYDNLMQHTPHVTFNHEDSLMAQMIIGHGIAAFQGSDISSEWFHKIMFYTKAAI